MEKVYVFGCGNFFKSKKSQIEKRYIIQGIVDNHNTSDAIVKKPEEVIFADARILLMIIDGREVFKQLIGLGVLEQNIILGENEIWDDDSEETILVKKNSKILYRNEKKYILDFVSNSEVLIDSYEDYLSAKKKVLRELYSENIGIKAINDFSVKPLSRDFGTHRGKPIDRYYIEKFLEENKKYITGDVLEIADNNYTKKYGKNYNSSVMHVEGIGQNVFKGNLETGEGLCGKKYDCVILTQVLMFIFDLKKTMINLNKILKDGGVALITVAGISQISRYDADRWGSYWNFNLGAIKKLFYPMFGEQNVQIQTFGNYKLAVAMMYGMCCEELDENAFNYVDQDYPLIYTIQVKKDLNNGVLRFIGNREDDNAILNSNNPIIICGAGEKGIETLRFLQGHNINPFLFADNHKKQNECAGIKIIKTNEALMKYPSFEYVITGKYTEEISNQVIYGGAKNVHIWL